MSLEFISISEARENKKNIDYNPFQPKMTGIKTFQHYPVEELVSYIDWTPFFTGWGLKGKFPGIMDREKEGNEAKRIYKEGKDVLTQIIEEKIIEPQGIIGLFPANSEGDDIMVYDPEKKGKQLIARLPMLRQQVRHKSRNVYMSLSDFIAPRESGILDYIGMFAVTAGTGVEHYTNRLKKENDAYNSLMFRFIADRLTEAFAERLHERVRKEFWGYAPDEKLNNDELIREKYDGTRPAPGYPACPDHSLKKTIFEILQVEERIGVSLTPEYVMKPVSSISGFYFSHPDSNYFRVGKISDEQVADYAKRNQVPYNDAKKLLRAIIVQKPGQIIDKEQIQDN